MAQSIRPGQEMEDADAEEEAVYAVRTIGTNGVPCMIRWLRKDNLSSKVERLVWLRKNLVTFKIVNSFLFRLQHDPAAEGMYGFEILGSQATAALPELYRIATNSVQRGDSPYAPSNARRAISYIEPPTQADAR